MMTLFCRPLSLAPRAAVGTFLGALLLVGQSGTASTQEYPSHAITLVVPFTPGTGYDMIARVVGPELSKQLGQPVVVENRPGASSLIGARSVARSAADGYTLLMIGDGTMAAPHLSKANSFDAVAELTPISLAGYGTLVLAASSQSGIKTVADLIAAAKAAPGKLNYATPGVGTTQNLKMEQIANVAGIKLLHIPYRGSAPALNDLIGGHVQVALIPIHQALEHIAAGALAPLAVISPTRNEKAPNVPTLAEIGIQGVEARMWYAFMGPKGISAPISSRLNSVLHNILARPDVRAQLDKVGLEVVTSTPAELEDIMRAESKTMAEVIRNNGLTAD